MNRFTSLFLLTALVLPGCISRNPNIPQPSFETSQEGQPLESFDDIHSSQIGQQFIVLGETYLTILGPNGLMPLEGYPDDDQARFVGLLRKVGENSWVKYARLTDLADRKNVPIEIWEQKGGVRFTVSDDAADDTRAGTFKVFLLRPSGVWQLESCGSYTPEKGNFQDHWIDYEYYQYSSFDRSYQVGPVFRPELGEALMVNEPACDNASVQIIR